MNQHKTGWEVVQGCSREQFAKMEVDPNTHSRRFLEKSDIALHPFQIPRKKTMTAMLK